MKLARSTYYYRSGRAAALEKALLERIFTYVRNVRVMAIDG